MKDISKKLKKAVVISVLNQKGGSGKTTIATNLACGLLELGYKTLLVDGDPQGSARNWNEENEGSLIPVIGLDRSSIATDILSIKPSYDVVVIDGAPSIAKLFLASMRASDVVLIPVQPSPYDVWSTEELVDYIKERRESCQNPQAAFILSRVIKNTNLSRDVIEPLSKYGFPILESFTSQSVHYPDSASRGESILCSSINSKYAIEFRKLVSEVVDKFIEPVSVTKKEAVC
jgi:chromosome partitioning protein